MVTRVFLQNNTNLHFTVDTNQAGADLAHSRWEARNLPVRSGERAELLWFNRDAGITNGQSFFFATEVSLGGDKTVLRQKLDGRVIGSKLWFSVANQRYSDDRIVHLKTEQIDGRQIDIRYRGLFTGGDDDIEYSLHDATHQSVAGPDELSVLFYNVFLRPYPMFGDGQPKRAELIPNHIQGNDVIAFCETFDDPARHTMLRMAAPAYPYRTKILGEDRGLEQDGGVIMISKYEFLAEKQMIYQANAFPDSLSEKGALYATINKNGRTYHLFATHTQANSEAIRKEQFRELKRFIDLQNIPVEEPVLIVGDLNVDAIHNDQEHADMLAILEAQEPATALGHPSTADPTTNRLANGDVEKRLDYVLVSRNHIQPTKHTIEHRVIRSIEPWCETSARGPIWDLSDHYAVRGCLNFAGGE